MSNIDWYLFDHQCYDEFPEDGDYFSYRKVNILSRSLCGNWVLINNNGYGKTSAILYRNLMTLEEVKSILSARKIEVGDLVAVHGRAHTFGYGGFSHRDDAVHLIVTKKNKVSYRVLDPASGQSITVRDKYVLLVSKKGSS